MLENWLIGETVKRPNGERVSLVVDIDVRRRLLGLLHMPEMRGVGHSEFIERAINLALLEMGYSEENF